jgi:hypothetical protein
MIKRGVEVMRQQLKYNSDQHRGYLDMIEQVSVHWLEVFGGKEAFYSAQYWDLFKTIWRSEQPVTKTEALKCMTGIKSAHTAGRYLETALKEGLLVEEDNPADKRSRFIRLSPAMQERLDRFFDNAVTELRTANRAVEVLGPSPEDL